MRIGFDVDGVLANFYPAYESLIIRTAGEDRFGSRRWPNVMPQTWNWPETFGYDAGVMSAVWRQIKESETFWRELSVLERLDDLLPYVVKVLSTWFITDRPGPTAQKQTEDWLINRGISAPRVIISNIKDTKGVWCKALEIDVYMDDKLENVLDVQAKSPATRAYLIERPYNLAAVPGGYTQDWRVHFHAKSVREVLTRELGGLNHAGQFRPAYDYGTLSL